MKASNENNASRASVMSSTCN